MFSALERTVRGKRRRTFFAMISQRNDRMVPMDADSLVSGSAEEPVDAVVQRALSADIHLLGDLLGAVIRRLAGDQAFALVEGVRTAAKALRAQPSLEEARRLRDSLDTLDLSSLRTLVRAFSVYFDLLNLAEQQARVRSNRLRTLRTAPDPLAESPAAALRQLRERGIRAEQVAELLQRALLCPVFTAHPSKRVAAPSWKNCWPSRISWIAWNTAPCCRASGKRHWRQSQKKWRRIGCPIPSGQIGPPSYRKSNMPSMSWRARWWTWFRASIGSWRPHSKAFIPSTTGRCPLSCVSALG